MPDYSVKQLSEFSILLTASGRSGGEAFSLPNTLKLELLSSWKSSNKGFFSPDSQGPHLFDRVFYSVCLLHVYDTSLPINTFLQRLAV